MRYVRTTVGVVSRMATLHIKPVQDFFEHEDDDCPCLPITEPMVCNDSSINWLVTHNAWDGRE